MTLALISNELAATLRSGLFYDFVAAALMTVGLTGLGVAPMRGVRDLMLTYLAALAFLYGLRLGMDQALLRLLWGDVWYFRPARAVLDLLVVLSVLLFLRQAGFLKGVALYAGYGLLLAQAALLGVKLTAGDSQRVHSVNNVAVIVGVAVLLSSSARQVLRGEFRERTHDLKYVGGGFAAWIAGVIWDNAAGLTAERFVSLEPIGFVIFLCALGHIAIGRTLRREEKLISLESELELARTIQMSILPVSAPRLQAFRVAARYVPMTDVAGDFYDYVVCEEGRLAILVADVSGHGIPAALIASMVKLAAASQREQAHDPAAVLARMNAALCGNTQTQFVTAAFLYLDAGDAVMRYAGAGHPAMLRLRDREVAEFAENGLMLAAFPLAEYCAIEGDLRAGDRLVLYTDGLLEAANANDEFFGMERMKRELLRTSSEDAESTADAILKSVRAWAVAQEDDLTLVVCDYRR